MAHYAIGDVQGCLTELKALLDLINFDTAADQLWFAGDIVNRGPESLATLRFVKSLPNTIVVLGNHDLHLLAISCGHAAFKKQDTMQEVFDAPDHKELLEWLRYQPVYHHDSELGFSMMHAGLAPQWDAVKAQQCANELEAVLRGKHYSDFFSHMYGNQPNLWQEDLTGWDRLRFIANCLTRLRFCDTNGAIELTIKGTIGSQPEGFLPWFKVPHRANKDLRIIFGHWASLQGKCDEPNLYPLDTGCVWGNSLTAMRLEDETRFSVPCVKRA